MLSLKRNKQSLSSIIDSFSTTLEKLNRFNEESLAEQKLLEEEIKIKENQVNELSNEINQATTIASNLKKLLNI